MVFLCIGGRCDRKIAPNFRDFRLTNPPAWPILKSWENVPTYIHPVGGKNFTTEAQRTRRKNRGFVRLKCCRNFRSLLLTNISTWPILTSWESVATYIVGSQLKYRQLARGKRATRCQPGNLKLSQLFRPVLYIRYRLNWTRFGSDRRRSKAIAPKDIQLFPHPIRENKRWPTATRLPP